MSLKVKQVYEALPSGMEDGADSMQLTKLGM